MIGCCFEEILLFEIIWGWCNSCYINFIGQWVEIKAGDNFSVKVQELLITLAVVRQAEVS